MKSKDGSLYTRLWEADRSLRLREWVFYAAIVGGLGLAKIKAELEAPETRQEEDLCSLPAVFTSMQAISKMLSTRTLRWKLDQSREAARQVDQWAPDKKRGSLPEQIKQNLRKQIFNASMENLTVKEMVMLHRTQNDETRLALQLYDLQAECAGIIAEVLRGGTRAEDLQELAADRQLGGKEFIEAIRQRVYGDLAAEVPVAEEGGAV